jgi:cell wall-associated NlpC family hydrolase
VPLLATLAALTATMMLVPGAAAEPRTDPAKTERELRQAWEQLEVVVEQYNDVREDLAATRAKSAALTTRIAPLREAMQVHEVQVGGLAASAYRGGAVAEVNALLTITSPEQFADRLTMLQRLANQQSRALNALAQVRRNHESARGRADALAAAQRTQQRQLAEKKRHIQAKIRRLENLRGTGRRWGSGGGGSAGLHDGYVPAYAPGKAGAATKFAYAQLGKAYGWGADGPKAYDCSGLTSAAWRAAGVRLPHNSARQWQAVDPVSRAELRQGDIVFYYPDIHHVGLYVGDGKIIHAPTHGERVRVEAMTYAPIYGYGRP